MDNKLAVKQEMSIMDIGKVFKESGYFKDIQSEAQAIVKIMAGRENGFDPFASMTGISIIQGKPEIGAGLIAQAVKRSGRYNYRVKTLTNELCEIEFFEDKIGMIGISSFSMADAKAAGLAGKGDMYSKYARNMLFSRAMSNGQSWFCPDVFQCRMYAEGEIPRDGIELKDITPPPVVTKTYASDIHPPAPEQNQPTAEDQQALKDKINHALLYCDAKTKGLFDSSTNPDKWNQSSLDRLIPKMRLNDAEIADACSKIEQAFGAGAELQAFGEFVQRGEWKQAIELSEDAQAEILRDMISDAQEQRQEQGK
jgi:hypothetical protein